MTFQVSIFAYSKNKTRAVTDMVISKTKEQRDGAHK